MAIVYTNSWEATRSDSYDSRTFGTVAVVVSTDETTLTPVNVLNATHATTGVPLPSVGQQSDLDTRYFVQQVSVPRFDGPRYATVSITYGLGKGSGEKESEDPLVAPTRFRVRNGVSGEKTDADIRGRPLLNSAGDPFAGTIQTNISAIYIDVIRNESAYNLPQAISFANKINADVFSLAGYPINPGEAYCLGIQPERDYTLLDTYVPVVYSFELRERLTLNNGGRKTAFIHRILDQGKRAWASVPGGEGDSLRIDDIATGETANPIQVSSDVLLNGNGQPLESDSFIGMNNNWEAWDAPPENKAPHAVRDTVAATGATFMLYDKHYEANFGSLGL